MPAFLIQNKENTHTSYDNKKPVAACIRACRRPRDWGSLVLLLFTLTGARLARDCRCRRNYPKINPNPEHGDGGNGVKPNYDVRPFLRRAARRAEKVKPNAANTQQH